jgi:glycosyltransferase involved in cell wall biosynthesis
MNVVVMDTHNIEDGRIQKHIKYLLGHGVSVYHQNINRYFNNIPEGRFSAYGEMSNSKTIKPFENRIANYLFFNISILSGAIGKDVNAFLSECEFDYKSPTIIHVHDPILLILAVRMKKGMMSDARIIYDRHEIISDPGTRVLGITIPSLNRLVERACRRYIDGVITVADEYRPLMNVFFPSAQCAVVPNFPDSDEYDDEKIEEKIEFFEEGSDIVLNYIGSLHPADRDMDLLLDVMDSILSNYEKTRFLVAGFTSDAALKERFERLTATYPGRFLYLGRISRKEVVEISQCSHIGFLLMKPVQGQWILTSPNKVYENLTCGTISVIRANIDDAEKISHCSLLFDQFHSEEEVLAEIHRMISDPKTMKSMMRASRILGEQFTWDNVASNYLEIYRSVLNGARPDLNR